MLISEQEKRRILEMHLKSGYRTLITEQETSPKELYAKGDRKGLYELALSTDSENVKSHPVYKNTLEWWLRGQGVVNPLVGEKGRKKTDVTQSLKSLYRWLGGDANVGSSSSVSTLDKYIKFIDGIIENKSEFIGKDSTSFSEEKFKKLESAIQILKSYKTKGIVMTKPELLLKNLDQVISDTKSNKLDSLKLVINDFPNKVNQYVEIYNNKSQGVNTFWRMTSSIDDNQKIEILKEIELQSKNYWENHQKIANSVGGVVDIATDLYIAPINENLGGESSTEIKTMTISGGYPSNPNGEGSSEWIEAKNFFTDDGIQISEDIKNKLLEEVRKTVDYIKSINGKITSITTHGFSSTSKVPTRYGTNSSEFKPENNVKLSQDRLNAINTTLAEAFKENGVTITPTVEGNVSQPNMGPEWTDDQRNNKAEYGERGSRTEKYEKEYGRWRQAYARFKVTFESSESEVQKTVSGSKLTNWNIIINWGREGRQIKPPTSKTKTDGKFSKWEGSCPYFN